ncbi:MAG: hypothetical protein ACLT1C_00775 [Weissella confusa]
MGIGNRIKSFRGSPQNCAIYLLPLFAGNCVTDALDPATTTTPSTWSKRLPASYTPDVAGWATDWSYLPLRKSSLRLRRPPVLRFYAAQPKHTDYPIWILRMPFQLLVLFIISLIY